MTPDPSWKEDVLRLAGAWIDGHDDGVPEAGAASPPPEHEEVTQRYLADLLLVDALLSNMSHDAARVREQRIRRVMQALDEPAAAVPARARMLRWAPLLTAAAVLLVVVLGSWIQFARQSLADDLLTAVNEVSAEAIDRVYSFQRVRAAGEPGGEPAGRLYLRGRAGFVIVCDQAVLGRNADQFWVVVPPQNVFLSHDFQWIDARATQDEVGLRFVQQLSLESRHIPLMQLASVAELMQHDYDVTVSRVQFGPRVADLLQGQRRSARTDLPAVIRLWSDHASRIIQRAELSWAPDNTLALELLPAEPVADQWYDYPAHCQGVPAVQHVPQGR